MENVPSPFSQNRELQEKISRGQTHARIDLRKHPLTDADMEFVIKEAIIGKQCTMLWLTENQLHSRSVSLLAAALSNTVTLEGLSLCNNGITDSDVLQLAKELSTKTSTLHRLALTSNNISDHGVQYLADMLTSNETLAQLWLGCNHITDQGVQLLMKTLAERNRTLQVLSLSSNTMITDSSLEFLLEMLDRNQTLRVVCLLKCSLSETSKEALRQAAKLHREFYFDL